MELAASIVAFVGVAGTAAKLSKSLYSTARRASTAKEDIETLALHIGAFSSVLSTAQYSLKSFLNNQSRSFVVDYVEEHHVLGILRAQSDLVNQHIKKLYSQVKAIPSSIGLIARFKWLLQKSEVLSLYPEMESVKTNIMLLILTLRLGAIEEGIPTDGTTEDAAQEIKYLKKQIRVQLQTITLLQERQERFEVLGSANSTSSFQAFHLEAGKLVDLAERMVRSEVPQSTSSFSSSTHGKRPVVYIPDGRRSTARKKRPTIYADRKAVNHQISGEVLDHTERHPVGLSSTSKDRSVSPLRIPSSKSRPRPSSITPNVTQEQSRETPVSPSTVNTYPIPPPVTRPKAGGDYLSVRSSSYLLDLDPDGQESVEGYINNTSKGPVHATANLDPKFGDNLISGAYAAHLGLPVEPLDEDDEKEFQSMVGGPQIRKLGKITLIWSKGSSSHRRAFPVHCWVCEHNIRQLIFGQSFLEKRNYYWGGRSSSDEEQTLEKEQWVEVDRPSAMHEEDEDSPQRERGQVVRRPTSSSESGRRRLRHAGRRIERDPDGKN